MREARALASLRICAGSSEPLLLANLLSTKILSAGLYITDVCNTSYNFQTKLIKSQKSPKMFMDVLTQTAICDIVYRFGNLTDAMTLLVTFLT